MTSFSPRHTESANSAVQRHSPSSRPKLEQSPIVPTRVTLKRCTVRIRRNILTSCLKPVSQKRNKYICQREQRATVIRHGRPGDLNFGFSLYDVIFRFLARIVLNHQIWRYSHHGLDWESDGGCSLSVAGYISECLYLPSVLRLSAKIRELLLKTDIMLQCSRLDISNWCK